MIKLSLPGFYSKFKYVKLFLEYYYNYSDLFYKDRTIDSFYDAEPHLLWRGGRIPTNEGYPPMEVILDELNSYPIKLRHTFTNCLLNDSSLINDFTCNHFVKHFIRKQDEVILNSPLLIEHFKNNYPEIPIIYSTTINVHDIDKVNTISENNIYVMNYNYNNDNQYINQLTHKENIEILCAEPCQPNCPYRTEHYKIISKAVLLDKTDIENFQCPLNPNNEYTTFFHNMSLPTAITNERIKELEALGFQYFKISGRTLRVPQWLYTILYYLAIPEYMPIIYQELLDQWW